jgi:hypothetical protein
LIVSDWVTEATGERIEYSSVYAPVRPPITKSEKSTTPETAFLVIAEVRGDPTGKIPAL